MTDSSVSRRGFLGAAAATVGAVALSAGLAGCSESSTGQAETATTDTTSTDAAATDTATTTPAADVKPVIMVVSFGTSYNESRHITIGAIEDDIREAYPDYEVVRAFTADTIVDKLKKRDGREIMNVDAAFQYCIDKGVKELVVQPTHLMAGHEYTDVQNALEEQKANFEKTALGKPLLDTDDDYQNVMKAIVEDCKDYDDGKTAIIVMGHGTDADSNEDYSKMQQTFTDGGYKQYFVTTVEATPSFDDTIKLVKKAGFKKALLRPFMVVAGDHATNDMADASSKDSLAGKCKAAGIDATPLLRGLGQVVAIDEIYVAHVKEAISALA